MQLNDNEKIEEIIFLLSENGQETWSDFLKNCLLNFKKADDKKEAVNPIIRSMLGGMGSLSDVVLYKNGKMLIEENNELYELLNKLYSQCKETE
ncbi:MAG: hypothetical protein Q8L78_01990 [Coxiellaceae bacterium]|nr:hypothetical protein [Coxiellaceae bacterium]